MEFYSIQELAKRVGVHENTVRNWIDRGELKAYKMGKVVRIKEEDFKQFVKETDTKK